MVKIMYFKQIHIGGYDNNLSYLVGDERTREVAVVDPDNIPLLQEMIEEDSLKVTAILLTHGHHDHTAGCKEMHELSGAAIYMHPENAKAQDLPKEIVRLIENGQEIVVGTIRIKAISTPGHTPCSTCYLADDKLLTGDTLFIDGCGRCDLTGGDPQKMYHSLNTVIGKLPDNTEIYPGHDYGHAPHASLAQQKSNNKYYLAESEEDFIALRMGY